MSIISDVLGNIVALYVAIAVHEAGHAIAIILRGIPLSHVEVGVGWQLSSIRLRQVRFTFRALPWGGVTVPALGVRKWRCLFLISAAGPAANIITGAAAIQLDVWDQFATMSFLGAIINLIPTEGSDGALMFAAWRRRRRA